LTKIKKKKKNSHTLSSIQKSYYLYNYYTQYAICVKKKEKKQCYLDKKITLFSTPHTYTLWKPQTLSKTLTFSSSPSIMASTLVQSIGTLNQNQPTIEFVIMNLYEWCFREKKKLETYVWKRNGRITMWSTNVSILVSSYYLHYSHS